HQPMHAGDHQDLGGNRVAANYGIVGGRTNLHGIWDGWLAERAISTPPAGPTALLAQIPRSQRERIAGGTVEDWSREMWAKSRDQAYKTMLPDPCSPAPTERPVLDEAEVRALIPLVRENVASGGIRLARLLDNALGPEARAPGQKRP
ncbi:MAG: S1/P1 nuclease, partial [Sphingomicrobium sp.]